MLNTCGDYILNKKKKKKKHDLWWLKQRKILLVFQAKLKSYVEYSWAVEVEFLIKLKHLLDLFPHVVPL